MNGNAEKKAITWYKARTGFLTKGKIYLTHDGIEIPRYFLSDMHVPYTTIIECSYSRSNRRYQEFEKDNCFITYIDKNGSRRVLQLSSCVDDPLGALKACHSILFISQQKGYEIKRQLDKNIAKFVKTLEDIKMYPEFIESEDVDIETSANNHWKRKLGTLKLSNSNIYSIKVTESGYARIETRHSDKSSYTYKVIVFCPEYHFDFTVKVSPVPHILSLGTPTAVVDKEKIICGIGIILFAFFCAWSETLLENPLFSSLSITLGIILLAIGLNSKKTLDYEWKGGSFAEKLNHDTELTEMLKKAKAPNIKIRANHIYIKDNKIPHQKLFFCIERIAEYVNK